jgi:hypothetical protein
MIAGSPAMTIVAKLTERDPILVCWVGKSTVQGIACKDPHRRGAAVDRHLNVFLPYERPPHHGPITAPRSSDEQQRLRDRFLEPEPPGDPIPPEIFTAQGLREMAAIALPSALINHWHLSLRQSPVDHVALRWLLAERYMYGQDDAPHDDLLGA